MKVLVCPDSFKGSMTAREVAQSLAVGVRGACPDAEIDLLPVADGGEGTVDCFLDAVGGHKVFALVHDPLGRPHEAYYGVLEEGTVVIEVAAAVGLGVVPEAQRDILRSNTVGVGELIRHAWDRGHRSFVIGLGGSATNDAGMGMLHALGGRFYDASGTELEPTPLACRQLARIDVTGLDPRVQESQFRLACDVDNPLCGPQGASAIYGPQKGATPDLIPVLDDVLGRFGRAVSHRLGVEVLERPGAGAAGGLGAAFLGVLGAEMFRGIELVFAITSFDQRVAVADLVLTGEGCTDAQTLQGKVVAGIAKRASPYQVPVVCVSGSIRKEAQALYECGVTALTSICTGPMTLEEAMNDTGELLTQAADVIMRVFLAGRSGLR